MSLAKRSKRKQSDGDGAAGGEGQQPGEGKIKQAPPAADLDVLDVFGPDLVPMETIEPDPLAAYGDGITESLETTNPVIALQVLLSFGGQVAKKFGQAAIHDSVARLATLPVGKSRSERLGAVILYSAIAAHMTNTVAGAHCARHLVRWYDTQLKETLPPVVFALMHNDLLKLSDRLVEHAWTRIAAMASLTKDGAFLVRTAPYSSYVSLLKGDQLREWAKNDRKDSAPWFADALQLSESPQIKSTYTVTTEFTRSLEMMAVLPPSVEPLLGIKRLPADAMEADNASPSFAVDERTYTSASGKAISRALGSDAGTNKKTSVLDALISGYKELLKAANITAAQRRCYQFLYVWLPIRTGIGFDSATGVFRPEPIANVLLRNNATSPLIAHGMFNASLAQTADPLAWTLAHEMFEFVGLAALKRPGDTQHFFMHAPCRKLLAWFDAKAPTKIHTGTFRPPFLNTLYTTALRYARAGHPVGDAPWLKYHVSAVISNSVDPSIDAPLRLDQRTVAHAAALYNIAIGRVGAPDPDAVYMGTGEINHGDFGADAVDLVRHVLPTHDKPTLYVFVGAALARVPVQLAYLDKNATCLVVAAMSLANNPHDGNHTSADRLPMMVRDEMARVSGDASLLDRVVFDPGLTLSEHHMRPMDIYNAGLAAVRRHFGDAATPNVYLVFNHVNAAVQFDVPEPVFREQARQMVRELFDADARRRIAGVLSTMQVDAGQTQIAPIGMPLADEMDARTGQSGALWLRGGEARAYLELVTRVPDAAARQRRAQMFRDLATGRPVHLAIVEDELKDLNSVIDAIISNNNNVIQKQLDNHAVRFSVALFASAALGMPGDQLAKLASVPLRRLDDTGEAGTDARLTIEGAIDRLPKDTKQIQAIRAAIKAVDIDEDDMVQDRVAFIGGRNVVVTGTTPTDTQRTAEQTLTEMRGPEDKLCTAYLNEWATAMFKLVDTCMEEYRANSTEITRPQDVLSISAARDVAAKAWPGVATCLDGMVAYARDMLTNQVVSLERAAGPAMLYAQLISDTLLYVQRIMETTHDDRIVPFAAQEDPHVRWAALMAAGDMHTTVLLEELLFERRSWITMLLAPEHRINVGMKKSMYGIARDMMRRSLELTLPGRDYPDKFNAKVKNDAKALAILAGEENTSTTKEDAEDMEREAESFTQQLESFTDGFHLVADAFRLTKTASKLPLNFFVPAQDRAAVIGNGGAAEADLVRAIQAAGARAERASLSSPDNMDVMADLLTNMFVELCFAYISGGVDAVISVADAYVPREKHASADDERSDIISEALHMGTVYRIEWPFEAEDPELVALVGDADASVAQLRGFEMREADPQNSGNVLSMPFLGFGGVLVSYPPGLSDATDDNDGDDDEDAENSPAADKSDDLRSTTYELTPRNGAYNLDPAQEQHVVDIFTHIEAQATRRIRNYYIDLQNARRKLETHMKTQQLGDLDLVTFLAEFRRRFAATTESPFHRPTHINDDRILLSKLGEKNQQFVMPQTLVDYYRKENTDFSTLLKENPHPASGVLALFANTLLYKITAGSTPARDETKFLDTQTQEEAERWWSFVLTPVPKSIKRLQKTEGNPMIWRMSPHELVFTMNNWGGEMKNPTSDDVDNSTRLRALLMSVVSPSRHGLSTPDLLKEVDDDFATAAHTLVLMWSDKNRRAEAKKLWNKVKARRRRMVGTDWANMRRPDSRLFIQPWIDATLDDAMPQWWSAIKRDYDADKDTTAELRANLEVSAAMVRLIDHIRADPNSKEATELERAFDAEDEANRKKLGEHGITDASSKDLPMQAIKSRGLDNARKWIKSRGKVGRKQSEIWLAALERLSTLMRRRSAANTVLDWTTLRLPSWAYRLWYLIGSPRDADMSAWSTVLSKLTERVGAQFQQTGTLRVANVLKQWKEDADEAFAAYTSGANKGLIENEAPQRLMAAMLKLYHPGASSDEILATTNEILHWMGKRNTAVEPVNLEQALIETLDEREKRLAALRKKQSDVRTIRGGEYKLVDPEKDVHLLGIYVARFEDPVLTHRDKVLLDSDRAEMMRRAGDTEEARILVAAVIATTRYVQFVDAANGFKRSNAGVMADFVARVRNLPVDNDYLDKLYDLLAERMFMDSLFYQGMNLTELTYTADPMEQ